MSNSYRKSVEMLFLAVSYMSVFSCLARTDYNFAFAFLCYYLWISKYDQTNSLIILVLNVLTTIVDIIWILSIGYIWTHVYKQNPLWNALNGIHVFVMVCSVINIILKIAIMALVGLVRNQQKADDDNQNTDNAYNQNYNYR